MDSNRTDWDSLSAGRNRMEKIIHEFLHPITQVLIAPLINRQQGNILDVATGTGEPGLTLASLCPDLKVTGIDNSSEMLRMAEYNASKRNIVNYETIHCDVSDTPFRDQSFDAVICRNGIMFFNNLSGALHELHRIMRQGASIHVATWGQLSKNLWIDLVLTRIGEITGIKPYRFYVPGMFYCMQPGFITDWLEVNGFSDVKERELTGIVSFDSIDDYWEYVSTVSAAVVNALRQLDPEAIRQVKQAISENVQMHLTGGRIYFQWTSNITTARK